MSFLFGSSQVSRPPLPQPVPSPIDGEAKAAAEEAALRQKRAAALAKGRATSILTSGQGVSRPANIRLKEALGE